MIRVLFVCVHNSARSQMAEAYLRRMAGDRMEVMSAGLNPTHIDPLVVEVMLEEGIDLSGAETTSVFDLYKAGELFSHVITVCEGSREAECPIFPGVTQRLHLPFDNPSELTGTREEKIAEVRRIRDQIKEMVIKLVQDLDQGSA